MQYFTIASVVGTVIGLVAVVQGAAIQATPPMNSSSIMKWTGPGKGGVNVTLYGNTVADIKSQLIALDPVWTPTVTRDMTKTAAELTPRQNRGTLFCCPVNVFRPANWNSLAWGASVLWNSAGSNGFPTGCHNVYCEDGAGIFICNDNDHTLDLDFGLIGQYASGIVGNCGNADEAPLCGQLFDLGGWNVVASVC